MTKRKTPFFFTFKGLSNSPIFQYLNFSFHRHFKGRRQNSSHASHDLPALELLNSQHSLGISSVCQRLLVELNCSQNSSSSILSKVVIARKSPVRTTFVVQVGKLWRGILDKIVTRSCAVRHYIVLHDYVAGDTIIVPDMLSYRNGDAIMPYHMSLDRAR